jgi:hypothetical protein
MADELVHLLALKHRLGPIFCASTVAKHQGKLGWSVFGLKEKQGPVSPWADISVVYMVCLCLWHLDFSFPDQLI